MQNYEKLRHKALEIEDMLHDLESEINAATNLARTASDSTLHRRMIEEFGRPLAEIKRAARKYAK
jgi:hypothetical protein